MEDKHKFGPKSVFYRKNHSQMCIQHVRDKGDIEAINIDMAPYGNKWTDKVTIQLDLDEALQMLLFLTKKVKRREFKFHNNKALFLTYSDDQALFSLNSEYKHSLNMKLKKVEQLRITMLVAKQVGNSLGMPADEVLSSLDVLIPKEPRIVK